MRVKTPNAAYAEDRWLLVWSGLLLALALLGRVLVPPGDVNFFGLLCLGLGVLAIISGLTYLYVRMHPSDGRAGYGVRNGLLLAAAGLVLFPVAAVLHNLVSALVGGEEPVFFLTAILLAPLIVLAGTLAAVIRALVSAGRAPAAR